MTHPSSASSAGTRSRLPASRVTGPLPEWVDVVVVGAGAAGCVVAARLSADPARSVLLLEAGEPVDSPVADVPGEAMEALGTSAVEHVTTTPQPGLGGRSSSVPIARCLGGGSAVNSLTWFQGHPEDYDGWRAAGADGWGWDDLASERRKVENHELGPGKHHGVGGPITVSTPRHLDSLAVSFVSAGEQAGLPMSEDLNGAVRAGVGLNQANIRDGRRHSVLDGYLLPALQRPNLTVRTSVTVDRVVVDGHRAVGVVCGGQIVRAERVVLAAGALNTPRLLLASGVGAADQLREQGIDVVVDLPGVGENLQDHVYVPVVWPVTGGRTMLDAHDEDSTTAYRLLRRGPLSTFAPVMAMVPLGPSSAPDIQLAPVLAGLGPGLVPMAEPAMSVLTILLTPRSRGRVRLRDGRVEVDPGYFSAPEDLSRLVEGVERASEVMAAPALAGRTGPRIHPTADAAGEALRRWVRDRAEGFWHPVGTARMGTDETSVVDPRLAVHGVDGLHVADASVMPTVTRGNTHAPTILVAERAAEFIIAHDHAGAARTEPRRSA